MKTENSGPRWFFQTTDDMQIQLRNISTRHAQRVYVPNSLVVKFISAQFIEHLSSMKQKLSETIISYQLVMTLWLLMTCQ